MHMIKRIKEASNKSHYILKSKFSTKSPRIAYVNGWLGRNNLGDELLLEAVRRLFPGGSIIPYPDSGGKVAVSLSKALSVFDYGLLAGGTIINKGPRHLRVAKECFGITKKNFVFGSGVCDPGIWNRHADWKDMIDEWKPLLDNCSYVGVRGPISAKLLQDAGISNVDVIGDPVLVLADDQPAGKSSCIPNSIGLNVGCSFGHLFGTEKAIQEEFIKLAKFAKREDWKVKWFVVWPEDLAITKQIAHASGTKTEIYEVYNDHSGYMDLVRPMSTFVGMKLHAVALATCAYVPSIMLEYRPKCRDYMQAIGQDEATVRTDHFKAELVWEILKDWNSQRSMLSILLHKAIKPVRNKQLQKAKDLVEILESI